jgi:hypothetical protein
MERLHGRSAVIGRGKKSVPSIGLLVGGDADRTVGMVGAVIMMMERLCQAGKEQEGDKE